VNRTFIAVGIGALVILGFALAAAPARTQFTAQDIAEDARWEDFLRTAAIVGETQLGGPDAVTRPWKLTIEKDGRRTFALWKYIDSRKDGVPDCWRFEIAAYRLDRLLGQNMVPVTVERPYKDKPGSLQLWAEGTETVKSLGPKIADRTRDRSIEWNRLAFVQRVFDDLLANEDRNANNILVTADARMLLIDHSRAFRTARPYLRKLVFGPDGLMKAPDGSPYLFKTLPRAFVERIRGLDAARIREAVGTTLTNEEIEAVLARKALVLREVESMIAKNGENQVLY
jgi:hypothetical protein